MLSTSEAPATLVAEADKTYFHQGSKETAHIEIYVKDKNGNRVLEANNEITIDISGPAKLLGLESGDVSSHEDYRAKKRKAFNGRLLAYIQSTGDVGAVKVTISSPGLKPAIVSFKSAKQ
jgi:beta-galactosidase